jgi:tetratricopeptide (TPR) repeat protein
MRLPIAFLLALLPNLLFSQSDNGLPAWREGNCKQAIPLLQAAAASAPADASLHAALLSALVYEGRVDDASGADQADAQAFPDSPEVTAARGEYAYYLGDMTEAQILFKAALKLKETTPRAYYGLSRVYRAASLYRTARLLLLRAHEIDPDDALITSVWMTHLSPEKSRELFPPFVAAHPWFYKYANAAQATQSDVKHELNGRRIFELDGEPRETTLHLISIVHDPTHVQGVGLEFKIEDRPPLRLLLDTGASGILISQRAVDKAGLNHLGSVQTWGIGDDGKRNAFAALSETCQIGGLKYKNCLMRATEGKHNIAGDADGLIGADFFSAFLIYIDFQRHQLHLTPQPPLTPNPQGYDRVIPPEEKDFTPVFRAGDHLFIQTKLNGKSSGLFLLDTGASVSNVDSTFARLSTKIYGNSRMHIRGISGEVKNVFEADKAVLQFAHYQQENLGLIVFDLNNRPDHEEFRIAGILGIPVLALFHLTLDYRNGLVKFEYIMGEKKK